MMAHWRNWLIIMDMHKASPYMIFNENENNKKTKP